MPCSPPTRLLIIVEGVERQNDASTTWWGGGLKDAGAKPVVLATSNRVVYSPHEYPASVYGQSWFSAPNYPANLPSVWDANWGYLARTGSAPIFVGEFGTKLETTSDAQWLRALVSYLGTNGLSFGYWSFNPNSGDTGGLVADDWKTPQTAKLAALAPLLGTPAPSPTPTPNAPPSRRPAPSTPRRRDAHAEPTLADDATTPRRPRRRHDPGPGPRPVSATWMLQSAWQDGYVAEFTVTASRAVGGWTISWSSPGATQVVNAWGMSCGRLRLDHLHRKGLGRRARRVRACASACRSPPPRRRRVRA
jgi:endoglucanase